jgi:hypothetical protein
VFSKTKLLVCDGATGAHEPTFERHHRRIVKLHFLDAEPIVEKADAGESGRARKWRASAGRHDEPPLSPKLRAD